MSYQVLLALATAALLGLNGTVLLLNIAALRRLNQTQSLIEEARKQVAISRDLVADAQKRTAALRCTALDN